MNMSPFSTHLLSSSRHDEADHQNRLAIVSLPKEWQDYDLKKDGAHAISDLQPFVGILEAANEIPDSDSGCFDTIVDTQGWNQEDLIVALDLEFSRRENSRPKTMEPTETKSEEKLQIRLNRDAKEVARRAFQRLELSVAKKLTPGSKKKKKNKKSKKRKDASESETTNQTNAREPSSRLLVGKVTDESTENNGSNNPYEIDTETFDAIGLCTELASLTASSTIGLNLSIPLEDESNGDNSNINTGSEPPALVSADFRFRVDSNLPVILATQTFESFQSKLFVGIPVVIQTTLLHATSVEVSWFVNSIDDTNGENEELVLRNGHSFVPEAGHVGKSLTVVLRPVRGEDEKRIYGKPEAYKFHNPIEELPTMPIVSPLRNEFIHETPETPETTKNSETPPLLRVCTYNILADLYVSRKGTTDGETTYPHVLYKHVEKARRIPMIVAELLAYKADIICLQEVDGSVYDSYFQPVMKASGYDGYYSNKASSTREGCAIFWSTSLLEVEEALSFDVKDLVKDLRDPNSSTLEWKESITGVRELLESNQELYKIATEKLGQVLQIARLKPKYLCRGHAEALLIANTHLFWHPMADHIRATQAYAVAKKLDEVRRGKEQQKDPFLLCGDLNSDPLSGAYQLLTTRRINPDHHDCWNYLHEYQWDVDDNDVEEMVESGTTAEERRSLHKSKTSMKVPPPWIHLPDVFPQLVSGCQPKPPFTNFNLKYVETLDYVLASPPNEKDEFGFLPRRSAPMPSVKDVEEFVSMPNELMPSDHVSIVCDLEWCCHSPE